MSMMHCLKVQKMKDQDTILADTAGLKHKTEQAGGMEARDSKTFRRNKLQKIIAYE